MWQYVQMKHTRFKNIVPGEVLITNKCKENVYVLVWQLWWHIFCIHSCLQRPLCCEAYQKFLMPLNCCYVYMPLWTICHVEIYFWSIYWLIWIFSVLFFINLSHVFLIWPGVCCCLLTVLSSVYVIPGCAHLIVCKISSNEQATVPKGRHVASLF